AWALPPLASRFLAAAAAAFAVASALTLWRGRWPEARLLLVILLGYFAPLLAALPLLLDRFDPRLPVTWGFFMAGGGMFLAAAWGLARGRPNPGGQQPAPPGWTRALVVAVGLAALVLGLGLLLAPATALAAWPWTWTTQDGALDALTVRLVAVMFTGV